MPSCSNCGKEIPEGSKSCKYCGALATMALEAAQIQPAHQHFSLSVINPDTPTSGHAPISLERPAGVVMIAALEIISGALALLTGLLFLFSGVNITTILGVAFGAVELVIGWGVWSLKKWGWTAAMIAAIFCIIYAFTSFDMITVMLNLILNGIILYYLTRPRIKAVFH